MSGTTLDRFESALSAWGPGVRLSDPLGGGHRNHVREVRIGQSRYAARLSPRSTPALEWELDLLGHLAGHGLRVPAVCLTPDGRRQVDGLVLFHWLDGDPPNHRTGLARR
ncbi:MAG: phosphotransferase, partial [Dehalococcoidia bacterium]